MALLPQLGLSGLLPQPALSHLPTCVSVIKVTPLQPGCLEKIVLLNKSDFLDHKFLMITKTCPQLKKKQQQNNGNILTKWTLGKCKVLKMLVLTQCAIFWKEKHSKYIFFKKQNLCIYSLMFLSYLCSVQLLSAYHKLHIFNAIYCTPSLQLIWYLLCENKMDFTNLLHFYPTTIPVCRTPFLPVTLMGQWW